MHRTVPWLLVMAVGLAACSDGSAPGSTGPEPPTSVDTSASVPPPSETASRFPPGRYTAVVPEGVESAPGRWTMTVSGDGVTWVNPETGAVFSPGEVVDLTSSTIVFAADPGCPDQDGTATTGTYGWVLDGADLHFTLVADSCAGRRDTLTSAPWHLAE